jgi:hypothetical protein
MSLNRSQTLKAQFKAIQDDREKTVLAKVESPICRICLCEEDADHQLINPCKCAGSLRFIGIGCLKEWLENKKHWRETPVVNSYIWK